MKNLDSGIRWYLFSYPLKNGTTFIGYANGSVRTKNYNSLGDLINNLPNYELTPWGDLGDDIKNIRDKKMMAIRDDDTYNWSLVLVFDNIYELQTFKEDSPELFL